MTGSFPIRVPRLGACSNIGVYILPGLLKRFQDQGGTSPEVVIGSNPQVVTLLADAEVDAALLEWWDQRDGFAWRKWRSESLVVIAAPNHSLSREKTISPHELARLPLIGGEPGTGTARILREYFAGGPLPAVSMQLGSTEAVKRAVEAGLGISLVLACAVTQEVREGRLCALALEERPLEKSLRLVWRDDVPTSDPLLGYLAAAADFATSAL
jgi:DNA-binding transcriptional LysR family regulator